MSIAEEWMPYRIGNSWLRPPNSEESSMTLEQLAAKGAVYRTRSGCSYFKGKLADYRRKETAENVITHVQEKPDVTIYFLKSYGLESWMIRITKRTK